MTHNDFLRALVQQALAEQQQQVLKEANKVMRELYQHWPTIETERILTNAQVSGLRTAVAWHHERPDAKRRLEFLRNEIKDRRKKSDKSLFASFYEKLDQIIWSDSSGLWRDMVDALDTNPNVDDTERPALRAEARLALALSVLDGITALLTTRTIQEQLAQQKGGWQWL